MYLLVLTLADRGGPHAPNHPNILYMNRAIPIIVGEHGDSDLVYSTIVPETRGRVGGGK